MNSQLTYMVWDIRLKRWVSGSATFDKQRAINTAKLLKKFSYNKGDYQVIDVTADGFDKVVFSTEPNRIA